jgi:hypothetical protein
MLLAFLCRLQAATITARSAQELDVVTAIAAASDGDTVVVPPGYAHWTTCLTINTAITLKGSGTNSTFIQDDVATKAVFPNGFLIQVNTVSNKFYRLTGFNFPTNTARTSMQGCDLIRISGTSHGFRIDNCMFCGTMFRGRDIDVYNSACGVIDHCSAWLGRPSNNSFIVVTHSDWDNMSYGNGSWYAPSTLGSSNVVCLEDCTFVNDHFGPGVTDGYAGARYIMRHCLVIESKFDTHGTEGSVIRGIRTFEVYSNVFEYPNNDGGVGVSIRSGTGVVWGNVFSNVSGVCQLYAYRTITGVAPFWYADGTNIWDHNGPLLYTGTHTGENGSPTIEDTNNDYTGINLRGEEIQIVDQQFPTDGSAICSVITANDSHTITTAGGRIGPLSLTNGNAYKIYHVIASLDMPGMGKNDIKIDGNPPTPVGWPNQEIEPVYGWDNTVNGVPNTGGINGYPNLIEGIHYINGVAKPGYIPLVYPHPLVSGVSGGSNPPGVAPPSDLRVFGSP